MSWLKKLRILFSQVKGPMKRRRPWTILRLEALEDRLCPSTVIWTNPRGGEWDSPGNWSTGNLPGPGDDAVINLPGITITHNQAVADAIHSLNSSDPIIFSAGKLELAASSTINGNLT